MGKPIQWAIYLAFYAAVFIAGYAWAIYAPDTGGAAVWGALGLALIAAAWLGVRRWRRGRDS